MSFDYFPGQSIKYLSNDTVTDKKQEKLFSTELLNKITDSSIPQHRLSLKLNQPIFLLRNIAQQEGLCNGSRLIIINMKKKIKKLNF